MVIGGGGKGKKGKKQTKQPKAETSKTFNIDFAVINKFGLVQVSPPLSPEDLDDKLKELTDTQKRFETKGNEELNKEKSDIEKNIERMVEEDIQAEIEAADKADNYEEEEKTKEQQERKPAPKDRIRKPKDDFFDADSDSDEKYQAAYAKPSRGGGLQVNRGGRRGGRGGNNLALNEEEFPTL